MYVLSAVFQEENGGPYKASIPMITATNPDSDVLLAYEMNGEVSVV
jgi:sulfite oxidase